MNIALVSIAYNGYERFINRWLRFVSEMDTQPDEIVIAVEDMKKARLKIPSILDGKVRVVHPTLKPNMGYMRNLAVRATTAEWIMYLSIDDKILPHAIDEFEKYQNRADWICIRWQTVGLGLPLTDHSGVTPEENYKNRRKGRGGGFIIAQSPYRRWIWEKNPYEEHDLPNAPFIARAVANGARFVKTERPCTVYLRRPDSHARTDLLRMKGKAIRLKKAMELEIDHYYQSK